MAQVDAMSGRIWQEGCGPEITEAYLTGTEPREMCGGGFEGQMLAGFEEPAMISEEQAMEMARDALETGHREAQIVADPAEPDTTSEPDTVAIPKPVVPEAPPPPKDTIPKKDSLSIYR